VVVGDLNGELVADSLNGDVGNIAEEQVGGFALESFELLISDQLSEVLQFGLVCVFNVIKNLTGVFQHVQFSVGLVAGDVGRHWQQGQLISAWAC
jgi:hypothetical protein